MAYNQATRIIGVSSGKGGVGKTTLSINLSAALHAMGHQNIIVDGDIANANLSIQLGLNSSVNIQDIILQNINPIQALKLHPLGLRIIPSSLSLDKSEVDLTTLREKLSGLNETFIVDFPAGTTKKTEELMNSCDEMIVITTPELTSITDSVKTLELARKLKKPILGIVINRVSSDKHELTPYEIQSMSASYLLGTIADDKKVKKSNFERLPYVFRYPYSKAAVDTRMIACKILGKPYNGPKYNFLKSLMER